jgi:hypothetical protein
MFRLKTCSLNFRLKTCSTYKILSTLADDVMWKLHYLSRWFVYFLIFIEIYRPYDKFLWWCFHSTTSNCYQNMFLSEFTLFHVDWLRDMDYHTIFTIGFELVVKPPTRHTTCDWRKYPQQKKMESITRTYQTYQTQNHGITGSLH